jgi:hypothetical protein
VNPVATIAAGFFLCLSGTMAPSPVPAEIVLMPKRRTLLCIALAIVAAGVGIYLCLPQAPRFTEDQFERIQIGMTQAEVEAVLGCGPGNYSDNVFLLILMDLQTAKPRASYAFDRQWACDLPGWNWQRSEQPALGICIRFNADGRVIDKEQVTLLYPPPTLLERLRASVGW